MSFRYYVSILLLVIGASAALPAGDETESQKLHSVLKKLAAVKTFSADFQQTHHIAFMKKPISRRGQIFMDGRNHRFALHMLSPVRFICVADGEKLTQWDEETQKSVTLNLRQHPMLSRLFHSFAVFQGNSAAQLESDFIAQLKGRTIILETRKNSSFYEFMTKLELTTEKDGRYIETIIFHDASGDRTEMVYRNVQLNQAIPPEKWSIPK